jgi:5-methylcytosine-specific restriction endonuclease McrA
MTKKQIHQFYEEITVPHLMENSYYLCYCCQKKEFSDVHHLIKRSRGFYYFLNPENCILVCRGCHIRLHNGDLRERNISLQEKFYRERKLKTLEDVINWGEEWKSRLAYQN